MTLFKDPNSYNYAFYGAIIVLAEVGSLFFGEPNKSRTPLQIKGGVHRNAQRKTQVSQIFRQ